MRIILFTFVISVSTLLMIGCSSDDTDISIHFDKNIEIGIGDSLYGVDNIAIGHVNSIEAGDSGGVVVNVDVENQFTSRLTKGKDFVYVKKFSERTIEMVTTRKDHEVLPKGATVEGYESYAKYHFSNRKSNIEKFVENFTEESLRLIDRIEQKLGGADSLRMKIQNLKEKTAEFTGPEERAELKRTMENISSEIRQKLENTDDWEGETRKDIEKGMDRLKEIWNSTAKEMDKAKYKAAKMVDEAKENLQEITD